MENWIRVSAKTVADAVTEATIQLGTSSDNIEYRVIEKGTAGFFGIGAKKAVIEAKKKKTDEDLMKEVFGEKEEKPKKESRKEPKKEVKASVSVEEKVQPEVKKEFKKEQKEIRKENKKEQKEFKKEQKEAKPVKEAQETAEGKENPENAPKEESREAGRTGRRDNFREGKRNGQKAARKPAQKDGWKEREKASEEKAAAETVSDEAAAELREERAPKAPRVPADPEEAKSRAEKFLRDLFQTMEMNVQMDITFEDEVLSVNIDGEDMGVLIGKRGQTLDSLQYLTSLVVNKGNASYVRVKLDTEDYRSRRKATLENLAKNIAMKVKKTRRPVFLEPMNPYERRIIHSALQNDPYVTTHSEGEEPCRKVVVTLRKNNDRYERRSQRPDRRPRQEAEKVSQEEVKEENTSEE
ncbi:MAG: KH domain-containing protein [Lachnospiraceae bacterium]|nr:KH domain-containing protein [Lachnospiraceae bacterium]